MNNKLNRSFNKLFLEPIINITTVMILSIPHKMLDLIILFIKKVTNSERIINTIFEISNPNSQTLPFINRISKKLSVSTKYNFSKLVLSKLIMNIRARKKLNLQDTIAIFPYLLLLSLTSKCNLSCSVCYAAHKGIQSELNYTTVENLIAQAKTMGIFIIGLTGGEPLLWPRIIDLLKNNSDIYFVIFTNGSLITDKFCDSINKFHNLFFFVSLKDSIASNNNCFDLSTSLEAIKKLSTQGIPAGYLITLTEENVKEFTVSDIIQKYINAGALVGWYNHYVPVGDGSSSSLILRSESKKYLEKQINDLRAIHPIILVDTINDMPNTTRCPGGGLSLLHVNSNGFIEPCPFANYSRHNINTASLAEALSSKYFENFRKFSQNPSLKCRCPILEDKSKFELIARSNGALYTWRECNIIG